MKIKLERDDFKKMAQDYVSYYFPEAVVTDIVFGNTDRDLNVSRVDVSFVKSEKEEK